MVFMMRISLRVLICFSSVYVISSSIKEYGDFSLEVLNIQLCHGPKRKDCARTKVEMLNSKILSFDLNLLENMTPTNGKVVVVTNGKPFLRLQMKKPCDHLFLRPLFHSIMNITNDCVILKSHYHFKLDVEEIASRYYGGSFVYGNFSFRSVFYNSYCNLYCTHLDVTFTPKNKTPK